MPGPIPAILGATMPWWLPWVTAGGGSWLGISQLQKGRAEGERGRVPSQKPEWLTGRTRGLMATPEYAERTAARGIGMPWSYAGQTSPKPTSATAPTGLKLNKPMTYEEAQAMVAKLGAGYYIDYDEDIGGYRVERDPRYFAPPETMSPYQEEQLKLQKGEASRKERESASDLDYRKLQLESEKLYRQQNIDLQKQEMAQQKANQQAILDWYQTQAMVQQQEAERQEGARLLANPQSWLQYNAYTGQTPTVQPWMRPLMEQQYKIGEAIPGWQGQQGGVTGQPMNTLQGLRTPSAQLFARMGPTAQSQYMGYEQARTGSRPEETAFRLRAGAPPSGGYAGLRRMR